MTVLAEIRGGFSVSPKYFGGFTVFGTPLQPPLTGTEVVSLDRGQGE